MAVITSPRINAERRHFTVRPSCIVRERIIINGPSIDSDYRRLCCYSLVSIPASSRLGSFEVLFIYLRFYCYCFSRVI